MAFKEGDWVEYMDHGHVLFTGRVLRVRTRHTIDVEDFTGTDSAPLPAYKLREAEPRRVAALLRLTMVPISLAQTKTSVSQALVRQYDTAGAIKGMWRGNNHTKGWHLLINTKDRWFWFNDVGKVVPT